MTRKHFQAIADAIAETRVAFTDPAELVAIDYVTSRLAYAVGQFNDHFDREKFMRTAGYQT
jgi:hypothetical protein